MEEFNIEDLIEKGYENLANAIIMAAVDDYREMIRSNGVIVKIHGKTYSKESIEKFFRSTWFSCLTQIDGEYLLRKLNQEGMDEGNYT